MERLRAPLEAWIESIPDGAGGGVPEEDREEVLGRLRALGYVE